MAHPHVLTFNAVPSTAKLNGTDLAMFFSQQYSLIQITKSDWRVKTEGYIYRLDDEQGQEIISYHWHPLTGNIVYPHLHFKRTPYLQIQKGHVPTGRIAIEFFVKYLIDDWGVKPLREDWELVLGNNPSKSEEFGTPG